MSDASAEASQPATDALTFTTVPPANELPAAELPAAELPAAELPAAELPAAELPAAGLPDAVVAMAERVLLSRAVLSHGNERRPPRAEPFQLFVHLREERAAGKELGWQAELHDGTALAGETLLRVACDCGIVAAKTDARGNVLDIGRRRRKVSAALRRALLLRDRHCRFPGCTATAFVGAHHIEHWARLGPTSLANTLLLCHGHHVCVHEGGFRVERDAYGEPPSSIPPGGSSPRRRRPLPSMATAPRPFAAPHSFVGPPRLAASRCIPMSRCRSGMATASISTPPSTPSPRASIDDERGQTPPSQHQPLSHQRSAAAPFQATRELSENERATHRSCEESKRGWGAWGAWGAGVPRTAGAGTRRFREA
jgi:hypothetical protein